MKLSLLLVSILCFCVLTTGQNREDPYFGALHYSLTDGERLYNFCKASESVEQSQESEDIVMFPNDEQGQHVAWCYGYVSAIVDSMPAGTAYFAPDSKVKLSQEVAVVTLYLRNHPELWHRPAAGLAHTALHEKFKK